MNSLKVSIITVVILGVMTINVIAQGSVPTMINYQGFLTDQDGTPLSGSYQITFALYSDSTGVESIVWGEETHDAININNGLFNVLLGGVDTLTAEDLDGDRYLGIREAGEPEMTPRMRLVSVAYSLQAEKAKYAKTLSATDGDPVDAVVVDTEGNVGVGVSSPTVKLDVDGVINASNSRPIRTQIVHRRVIFGLAGDNPLNYTDSWTYIRYLYGPFGYAIPAVQPGATRQYRLYAIYTDNISTNDRTEIRFSMVNAGEPDVVFTLGRTWGSLLIDRNRDGFSSTTTEAPAGHGFIEIKTTAAGTGGILFYLELQSLDIF